MSKQVKITIDEADLNVVIDGLKTEALKIDYSVDVDYTELVTALSEEIDKETAFELSVPDIDDSEKKLIIVVEMIKTIFDKYNESLAILEVDEESEGPWFEPKRRSRKKEFTRVDSFFCDDLLRLHIVCRKCR